MLEWQWFWPFLLVGAVVGCGAELVAWRLKLWQYRSVLTPWVNVLFMFGVVMGWVASTSHSDVLKFAVAGFIGLSYELMNACIWRAWFFPDERLGPFRGYSAISLALGTAWAAVPWFIVKLLALMQFA